MSQRLPSRRTFESALIQQAAADLVRNAHPHMLDDLFGAADMRRDLGDGFENQTRLRTEIRSASSNFRTASNPGM